jgi:hypothetical protein
MSAPTSASELQGQLSDKLLKCLSAADLSDPGDDPSKSYLSGFCVVIV